MRAFRHGHATARAACIYDNPGAMHFRFTPELVGRLSREPNVGTFRRARPQVEERGRGAVGAAEVKRRGIGIMSPYSFAVAAEESSTAGTTGRCGRCATYRAQDSGLFWNEAAAGMYEKPVEVLARDVHYEPLAAEVRAVVIAAWTRGGLLPSATIEHMVPEANKAAR